jgi:hypothetical protein
MDDTTTVFNIAQRLGGSIGIAALGNVCAATGFHDTICVLAGWPPQSLAGHKARNQPSEATAIPADRFPATHSHACAPAKKLSSRKTSSPWS